jgi:hypothetical protein
MCASASAATVKPVITLAPATGPNAPAPAFAANGQKIKTPANFRDFGSAAAGESADVQTLTLRFAASTKLQAIASTRDFTVESGGSCIEGDTYPAGGSCTLLVRFTPQGAGHRLGKLTIAHSASPTPAYVGLGGYGYAPVVSFIPAVIQTVPGSNPGGTGLLKGAQNLAVDGGDTLYVADTGNNLIRYYDSSGKFITISSGTLSAPLGIAVDSFGDVYFDEPAQNTLYEIFQYGYQIQLNGTGGSACSVASPCSMPNVELYSPGQMSIDASNRLFFVEGAFGAAVSNVLPSPPSFARMYDPFTFTTTAQGTLAVDAYDNLYSAWEINGPCEIVSQSYSNSANLLGIYQKVAGGRTCGFAGDGGQARNAEIGTAIGQIAFDIAGNLYFTDTANQRVRRIDNATGIIHTIAGTGSAGNTGDGGQATSANLNTPTGVAVDSQGQVYIINSSSSTNQVIRKVGPNGLLAFFTPQLRGTTSTAKTAVINNSGNSALTVTNVVFNGSNASDFSVDPGTTTCNFAAGNSLASGQSCQVGILFKPASAGARSANLVLLDNTVNSSNTIQLTGTGILPSPAVKITAPAANATFTSGATVKFTVSVTSTSGSAPSGNVTFKVDGATFGSAVSLSSGAASVNLTGLTVKTHTISATYNGDGNYAATTVTESITVKAAAAKAVASTLSLPAGSVRPSTGSSGFASAPLGFSGSAAQGCDEKAETTAVEPGKSSETEDQSSAGRAEEKAKSEATPSSDCKPATSADADTSAAPQK